MNIGIKTNTFGRIVFVCTIFELCLLIGTSSCAKHRDTDRKNSGRPKTPRTSDIPDLSGVPKNQMQSVRFYASQSDPVVQGTLVNLWITENGKSRLLVKNVQVGETQWEVPGPFMKPKFPAEGFVDLLIPTNIVQQISSKGDYSVRLPDKPEK